MGKRAPQFERRDGDFYPTPEAALPPLLMHVPRETKFYEPCAGDGSLAEMLVRFDMVCMGLSDIEPQHGHIDRKDATKLIRSYGASCFITNPPWDVALLHPIIENLTNIKPAWLLLYSDWLFTRQASPYLPFASHIVAVGRLKWIPDTPHQGKDNCCWVRFDKRHYGGATFYGR